MHTVNKKEVYRLEEKEVKKTVNGYKLAKDGNPIDADELRAEFFPIIRSRYSQAVDALPSRSWIDVSSLSFNTLLLLEKVQLSWFPGWLPEPELSIALHANPVVAWYIRHKCPELNGWLNDVLSQTGEGHSSKSGEIRNAEVTVMKAIHDLLTYAVNPAVYDALLFMNWDAQELTSLVDFTSKTVIDIGSGTGKLAFIAAGKAAAVYAVEPVANLRDYLKEKAKARGLSNVYAVDGLITELPFHDHFADVTIEGHVFGDQPEEEYSEMVRVTKPGGMVVLCPGNGDRDNNSHRFLISKGFQWSRFEEPGEGFVRKYWLRV
jgi:2-polyprenyl-3-methyl-5-hydroxy-6-metoxy-1,4-benzoquinol methylase